MNERMAPPPLRSAPRNAPDTYLLEPRATDGKGRHRVQRRATGLGPTPSPPPPISERIPSLAFLTAYESVERAQRTRARREDEQSSSPCLSCSPRTSSSSSRPPTTSTTLHRKRKRQIAQDGDGRR